MELRERSMVRRLFGAALIGAVLAVTIWVPAASAAPKPSITSFSPTSGPAGTLVTITGQNFTGVTAVLFRNASASFTFDSDTQVRATVPAGALTGLIKVTTPAGTGASGQEFTVTGAPTITSFSPGSGGPGTTVTVQGSRFTGATLVRFGAISAVFTLNSDTKITTSVPVGATTAPIQVVTPAGTATSATAFVVTGGVAPVIGSFTPTGGPIGTSVTILGSGFTGATEVRFAGVASVFTVNSDSQITAVVPAGATTGRIKVVTGAGTATSTANFSVTSGLAPTITSFSPKSGVVGTAVVIHGARFTGATQVTFNGVNSAFTVDSDTKISTKVPVGATTGRIKVITPAGTATSATDFAVGNAPTITSFSPTSGAVGTSVTIQGSNLTGTTKVTFNLVSAGFTVNSNAKITATVPPNATTGRIQVTTPAGTGTSASNFTVTAASPVINSISPTTGRVGAVVSIFGANFGGATRVKFGGHDAAFTVVSATQISATVPSGASTGSVKVTTPAGTATGPVFTVFHARRVTFKLRADLTARGTVRVNDGYGPCARGAAVLVQRRVSGSWRTVARVMSAADGSYQAHLRGEAGRYRALAPKRTLASGDVCGRVVSRTRWHGRSPRPDAVRPALAADRPIRLAVVSR